jgi:hypothetical protein
MSLNSVEPRIPGGKEARNILPPTGYFRYVKPPMASRGLANDPWFPPDIENLFRLVLGFGSPGLCPDEHLG